MIPKNSVVHEKNMKYPLVVTGLLLLVVANVLIVMRFSSSLGFREGFQVNGNSGMQPTGNMNSGMQPTGNMNSGMQPTETHNSGMPYPPTQFGGQPTEEEMNSTSSSEGFTSYLLENAAGSKGAYKSMGAYDGVQLATGNNTSVWRYTAPNEKLLGEEFVPGNDSLFMFKNNQCKPECCGASFSCGGGCVCTTPQQRQYLAGRGGNRTGPEDSA